MITEREILEHVCSVISLTSPNMLVNVNAFVAHVRRVNDLVVDIIMLIAN